MSRYYGTVIGNANTPATRRGFKFLRTVCQSWDGSLAVKVQTVKDKDVWSVEYIEDDSGIYGEKIFEGSLEDLVAKIKA